MGRQRPRPIRRIQQADQVLFVADGAHGIWNRVLGLIKALGLQPERVHELIDFYHAVEHLGKVAALRKNWSAKERKAWIRKHRRWLLKGHVDAVVEAVRALCRGRHGKAMTTERNYFIRNQHRMAYPTLKALKLSMSSGAIESAVRRVINLRLQRTLHLLVQGECREDAYATRLLQGRTLECVETYGQFSPFSSGDLTGKMGMRPSALLATAHIAVVVIPINPPKRNPTINTIQVISFLLFCECLTLFVIVKHTFVTTL